MLFGREVHEAESGFEMARRVRVEAAVRTARLEMVNCSFFFIIKTHL